MSKHIGGFIVLSAILAAVPALAGVPNEIHHQGVIAVHGERFTGEGEFYFALVDELGYNLWTNDGSSVATPDPPTDSVTLTVVNGVYRVRLGHAPTVPIPRAVFNENDNVALRIWFDDGVHGPYQLSPDQVLTGAPYAQRLPNVFVDEDTGNVGIGTTAPTSRLSVSGSADFSGNVGIATTTPSNALSVDGNADVTGHLGLGTTNPQNKLDVAGAAVVGSSYAGATPGPVNGLLVEGDVGIGNDAPANKLSVSGSADFTGNVGIGTTAPSRRVTIEDTVGTRALRMQADSAVPEAMYGGVLFGRPDHELASIEYGTEDTPSKGFLSFATNDGVSHAERVRIDESGNVGIGTTSPEKKLHIGSETPNSEGMIRLQSKSGTGGAFRSWDIGVPETDQELSGAGYSFVINDVENGEEPEVTVKYSTGNVGIGTTNPQARLDVNDGSVRFSKYIGEAPTGWFDIEEFDGPGAALLSVIVYDPPFYSGHANSPFVGQQLVLVSGNEHGATVSVPAYSIWPLGATGIYLDYYVVLTNDTKWKLQGKLRDANCENAQVYVSKIQTLP